jgi:hypothetical protein
MIPVLALQRRHRQGWIVAFLAILGLAVSLLALAAAYRSTCACSIGTAGAPDIALTYARQHMVWVRGPTLRSSHMATLRTLEPLLTSTVSSSVKDDVNVPDLVHRFGANRKVALVVLTGVYNSLPPDEGMDIQGEVIALVDVRTDRVLLLTD